MNLRIRFPKYKITFDEAGIGNEYMQIPCQGTGVTIYPHSDTLLAVEVNHRPGIAKRLAHLILHQDGDFEKTFLFPLDQFEEVAAIVQPRKRRILTNEQKERLLDSGREHWFQ